MKNTTKPFQRRKPSNISIYFVMAFIAILWFAGKGVIWREDHHPYTDRDFRDVLFKEYGTFMTSLNGCYITAEDLGVTVDDMRQVRSE